jgi:hypothetical protein
MNPVHLLQKHGVLCSFNIVHTIGATELRKLKSEVKQQSKNRKDYQKKWDERMKEIVVETMQAHKIPGVCINGKPVTPVIENVLTKNKGLLDFAKLLSKQVKINKLTQQEQSYVIVSLTKILGLKLSDFKEWQDENVERPEFENGSDDDST